MTVGPRETASYTTSPANPDAPVVLLLPDKTAGKSPLTIDFQGGQSFDPNGNPLTFAWTFADLATSSAADTTVTFTDVGDHWVRLTVTNSLALSSQDSVMVTVLPNGGPFSGSPVAVPGRIEAEEYDLGGEGIAYHDVDANNIGLAFRPDEGVDIEGAAGGGYDVYWIVAGEWLEYTFSVAEPGYYDFIPYVSTVPGFGDFTLSIDNVDVSGRRNVASTGGWQFWTPLPVTGVPLTAGTHILRFDFDSDTDLTGWLFSMNYIDVEFSATTSEDDGEAPAAVGRVRNYPNPFNPRTTIAFELGARAPVDLRVFDASGRLVRRLVDGEPLDPGRHDVVWNGRDDAGKLLASGTYFYRLEAGEHSGTRKMVLMK
jgi:PKD repeat protein